MRPAGRGPARQVILAARRQGAQAAQPRRPLLGRRRGRLHTPLCRERWVMGKLAEVACSLLALLDGSARVSCNWARFKAPRAHLCTRPSAHLLAPAPPRPPSLRSEPQQLDLLEGQDTCRRRQPNPDKAATLLCALMSTAAPAGAMTTPTPQPATVSNSAAVGCDV